jgi:hypothetical protein
MKVLHFQGNDDNDDVYYIELQYILTSVWIYLSGHL